MKSSVIYTYHLILLGSLNKEGLGDWYG